ncbi:uncharacterized protein [Dysidea avara]|uniref:uncharacterized protein n=1 Tax=Dysidea avara TaxID=196820 RepID=UPI0033202D07
MATAAAQATSTSLTCCNNPNIQEDDCGTQDVLVCQSCGKTFPREEPLDYSEIIGEQVSDTYKRPTGASQILYRKSRLAVCKEACEQLSLQPEAKRCCQIVEEAQRVLQGAAMRPLAYGAAYLLGRKLRYNIALKQVARLSGVPFDKLGNAVSRLRAAFASLRDDPDDEINSAAAFELRAHGLLEQLEVGSGDEDRSAIIRQSSKVYQLATSSREFLTVCRTNKFILAVTVIGIENHNKSSIPGKKLRDYYFKVNGVKNNDLMTLVYAIKKLLYEMAQSIPWVKSILAADRKHADKTKIRTIFRVVDDIYKCRQLYTAKQAVSLESSYPHCLFTTSFEETKRRQVIVERLQKELNMVPVVDTNWPYLTGRKRREVVKPTSLVDEDILSEEVAIEENSLECYMDEVTRSAVNSVCCYSSDQLCDEPQEDYSAMEYEVCCEIPTVDTSQDISQDTNQDIIQHSSQNIYINHDNSSQDIVQDTTVEEVIQSEMSEQEMEGSIKELLVKGVSVERIITGNLREMLAGHFIHFCPSPPLAIDGGPHELTEADMSEDELMCYIKTDPLTPSHDPQEDTDHFISSNNFL